MVVVVVVGVVAALEIAQTDKWLLVAKRGYGGGGGMCVCVCVCV
jgi:hypothetical protein